MMKKWIAITGIGIVSMLGACSHPKVNDSSSLTIVPGVGVSNVVALGMTLGEIASRTTDYEMSTTRNPRWFSARVRSLGVSLGGPYNGKGKPYYGFINFHVVPGIGELQGRYTGSVEGGLSVAESGRVRRDDVVAIFGSPLKDLAPENSTNMFRFLLEGTSYSMVASNHTEILYYPADGIMFETKSGLVTRVAVYPKQRGRTSTPTLRR